MTCHFCGRPAVDPIPRGALTIDRKPVEACRACWEAHDDADQAAMFSTLRVDCAPPDLIPDPPPLAGRRRSPDDLTGLRFGRLLVLGPALVEHTGGPRLAWRVRCGCGRETVMRAWSLWRGARECQPCGQRSGPKKRAFCKLSATKSEQVRIARARGWTMKQIGERFGVAASTVHQVVHGKAWRPAA